MQGFQGNEIWWLLILYSFFGWVLETVNASVKRKQFINRGLINGPFCLLYGVTAVVITLALGELRGFWLFAFSALYATVAEWIGGHLIEKFFSEKWWDYSKEKWNLDGYICLKASLLWGVCGYVAVRFLNRGLVGVLRLLPSFLNRILLFALLAFLLIDALATYLLLTGHAKNVEKWSQVDENIDKLSEWLTKRIAKQVLKRIDHAYPQAKKIEKEALDERVFAAGCSVYKLFLLFFIGAFLGDITETIFCRVVGGVWMSRSSVVWGPFSIVWGLALALVTALLYRYKDRGVVFLFSMGTFLGGAYEYLCSVFTELVFGTVFWDYSHIPFNLGGRINLLYCFFWGLAAVVWFRVLFPRVSTAIEKIPKTIGTWVTRALMLFMVANIIVSSLALARYDERGKGIEATNAIAEWVDEHYPNEKMQKIYPNAQKVS